MAKKKISVSHQSKHYFTLGTVVASLALPTMVGITWAALRKLNTDTFHSEWWPFALSFAAVYFIAWVIPEPEGYQDEGKLRLTLSEIVSGFFMSMILGATVVGLDKWLILGC
jgi:hypothetical protein